MLGNPIHNFTNSAINTEVNVLCFDLPYKLFEMVLTSDQIVFNDDPVASEAGIMGPLQQGSCFQVRKLLRRLQHLVSNQKNELITENSFLARREVQLLSDLEPGIVAVNDSMKRFIKHLKDFFKNSDEAGIALRRAHFALNRKIADFGRCMADFRDESGYTDTEWKALVELRNKVSDSFDYANIITALMGDLEKLKVKLTMGAAACLQLGILLIPSSCSLLQAKLYPRTRKSQVELIDTINEAKEVLPCLKSVSGPESTNPTALENFRLQIRAILGAKEQILEYGMLGVFVDELGGTVCRQGYPDSVSVTDKNKLMILHCASQKSDLLPYVTMNEIEENWESKNGFDRNTLTSAIYDLNKVIKSLGIRLIGNGKNNLGYRLVELKSEIVNS